MRFEGVVPAVLTPYRNGDIDEKALRTLVRFLCDKGVHGLYPCGTTGEGMLLSASERKKVAEIVVDEAHGRVPVMVHVGAISTAETIELARHAQSIGAQAIGVVAPYFYSVDKAGLVEHYTRVAEAVPEMPVYIYNIPGNAKNDVTADIARTIVDRCPNVVGVKDSSKDIGKLQGYVEKLGPKHSVLVGSDALVLAALAVGGAGVISAVANPFPEPVLAVFNAFKKGDLALARELQKKLNKLRSVLQEGPYLAAYKAALKMRGYEFGGAKAPMREMNQEEYDKLKAVLSELGYLQPAVSRKYKSAPE